MNRPAVVLLGLWLGGCAALTGICWGVLHLWLADPWSCGALFVGAVLLGGAWDDVRRTHRP